MRRCRYDLGRRGYRTAWCHLSTPSAMMSRRRECRSEMTAVLITFAK